MHELYIYADNIEIYIFRKDAKISDNSLHINQRLNLYQKFAFTNVQTSFLSTGYRTIIISTRFRFH